MVTMMMETMREEARENRKLMETLMLGRESTTSPSDEPSLMPTLTEFDYDSTPLSPGIEAQISREAEEDLLEAGRRERDALLLRMQEVEAERLREMAQDASEASLPAPWRTGEEEFENPM